MKTEEAKSILRAAIAKYGISHQLDMAHEEMGELVVALHHLKRGKATADDVITEIADVTIMIYQLAEMFGVEKVQAEIDRKLKRLSERMNNQQEEIFPQLAESEDERMRKAALEGIEYLERDCGWDVIGDIDILDVKEYLEKQKEQKPSTPKYRVGDVMRTKQEAAEGITDGLPVIVSVDEDYYYCTNEKIPISEQEEYEFPPMNMRQKSVEWAELQSEFKNINEAFEDGKKEVVAHPEKYGLCKPAEWDEDDERNKDRAIFYVRDYQKNNGATDGSKECIAWLKSLRPPLKDKEMKLKILKYLSTRCSSLEFEEVEDYLNNLRPSWKPSKEQMNALNALNCHGDLSYVGQQKQLISLYNDLKKLM